MTVFSICNKNIVLDHRTDLEAQYLNHKQYFPAQIEKNSCYCINTRKKMFLFICLDLFSPTDYKVKRPNDASSTIVPSTAIPTVTKFVSSSTKFPSSDEGSKTTMVYSTNKIVPTKSINSTVVHSTSFGNSTWISTIVPSASITPKPMTSSPAASSSLHPTPPFHTS